MRIDKIHTSLYKKTGNLPPQNSCCANYSPALNTACGIVSKEEAAAIKALYFPYFTGSRIIDLKNYMEKSGRGTEKALQGKSIRAEETSDVQKTDIADEEASKVLELVHKAGVIQDSVPDILERFKPVYKKASDLTARFEDLYFAESCPDNIIKCGNKVVELNELNEPVREAVFKGDMPYVIKDFENSTMIVYEAKTYGSKGEKLEVYLNCADMKNEDAIRADEFFMFCGGTLSRYGTKCLAYFDTPSFCADTVYTFKRNVFESYDKSLTISGGAEYSNEFFGFKLKPGAEYYDIPGNLTFARHVKNKISANGIIIYSTDETLMSWYQKFVPVKQTEQAKQAGIRQG